MSEKVKLPIDWTPLSEAEVMGIADRAKSFEQAFDNFWEWALAIHAMRSAGLIEREKYQPLSKIGFPYSGDGEYDHGDYLLNLEHTGATVIDGFKSAGSCGSAEIYEVLYRLPDGTAKSVTLDEAAEYGIDFTGDLLEAVVAYEDALGVVS